MKNIKLEPPFLRMKKRSQRIAKGPRPKLAMSTAKNHVIKAKKKRSGALSSTTAVSCRVEDLLST